MSLQEVCIGGVNLNDSISQIKQLETPAVVDLVTKYDIFSL